MFSARKCFRRNGACEKALQTLGVETVSPEERVDRDRSVFTAHGVDPHEEVPGKAHAPRVDPCTACDLTEYERQRDRNAEAALDHVGDEAIARIVVIVLIASETEEPIHVLGDGVGLRNARKSGESCTA